MSRSKQHGAPVIVCASRANIVRFEALNALLIAGADINASTEKLNITALMIAVSRRNLTLTEWLLKNGANPNARMQSGKTAIDMASAGGIQQIIDLIHRYSKLKI